MEGFLGEELEDNFFNEIYQITPNNIFSNIINSICKIKYDNIVGTGF